MAPSHNGYASDTTRIDIRPLSTSLSGLSTGVDHIGRRAARGRTMHRFVKLAQYVRKGPLNRWIWCLVVHFQVPLPFGNGPAPRGSDVGPGPCRALLPSARREAAAHP